MNCPKCNGEITKELEYENLNSIKEIDKSFPIRIDATITELYRCSTCNIKVEIPNIKSYYLQE